MKRKRERVVTAEELLRPKGPRGTEKVFLVQGLYGSQWTTDRVVGSKSAAKRRAGGYKKHGLLARIVPDWRPRS